MQTIRGGSWARIPFVRSRGRRSTKITCFDNNFGGGEVRGPNQGRADPLHDAEQGEPRGAI
jgi:hypothetical protein